MPRVIARVNHPKNEWMFTENWGVDVFVSTPQLITAMVEEAVSVGKLIEILRFEHGLARLVEVTLATDSPVVEKTISELAIPREATIVAILREEHLVVPRGESVFETGRRGAGARDPGLRGRDARAADRSSVVGLGRDEPVPGVVDKSLGTTGRGDTFGDQASARGHRGDLAPTEEHDHDRSRDRRRRSPRARVPRHGERSART